MKPCLVVLLTLLLLVSTSSGSVVGVAPTEPCRGGSSSQHNRTLTLNDALQGLTSDTMLQLEPGTHHIEDFTLLQDLQNISFIGMDGSECDVIITCSPGVGIALLNVSDLLIRNVRIDGCGLNGPDLTNTLMLLNSSVQIFYRYPNPNNVSTGLLLGYCSDVAMDNVTITNVRGYGVLGINVIGFSQLTNVHFTDNGVAPGVCNQNITTRFPQNESFTVSLLLQFLQTFEQYGSGAVFLYQDFNESEYAIHNNQQYSLDVDSATFTGNRECSYIYNSYIDFGGSSYIDSLGYRIGGGGGLTLLLAQVGYGVNVTVSSSYFHNNTATFGGSIYLALFVGLQNTHVVINDCFFYKNGAPDDIYVGNYSNIGPAGIMVINDALHPQQNEQFLRSSFRNQNLTFKVLNSNFTGNRAQYGSGLYVYSSHRSPITDISDELMIFIDNCMFDQNTAFLGSALTIYELKISGAVPGIQVYITNTSLHDNRIETSTPDGSVSVNQNFGTMDLRGINITFFGNCSFDGNNGTAVRAESCLIGIAGNVTLENNVGVNGGAFFLVSYSYIVMSPNSSLYLIGNIAQVSGGAFYVNEVSVNSFVAGGGFIQDCFLYFSYDDFLLCTDCSDLNRTGVYIEFSNNVAPTGSDVYGSALLTCPWALSLMLTNPGLSVFEILDKDFPDVFNFDIAPVGPSLVRSTAARLVIDNRDDLPTRVTPGESFNLELSTYDDFNQVVATVVTSFVVPLTANTAKRSRVSENNFGVLMNSFPTEVSFTVVGYENQNMTVVVFSTDIGGRAQATFSLELTSCGFGFIFDPNESICACNRELEFRGVVCDINTNTLIVEDGLWIGPIGDDDIAVHPCVFQFCEVGTRNISVGVDPNLINFDVQCAVELHRSGILCGSCMEGYSVTLGSARCLDCSNAYAVLYIVFLILGAFVIFAIRYLKVTITGGYLNGVIFYSNIVSLYGSILVPDTSFSLFWVSFPTLNLGIETCLHDKMTSLERVWWQLSFPLYLFILMGLTTLLAKTKYKKYFSGLSIIQAFATLLIVCYVSVLQACVELIGFVQIRSISDQRYLRWTTDPSVRYFSARHAPLAVLAIFLFLFYLIPLPLFLLFPSLLYRNRYLSKFKPIYDAFWDPFDTHFRFWLGLRLIFRWVPFILAFTVRPPISIFVTNLMLLFLLYVQMILQPFNGKWRNVVDSYFLVNLVAIFSGSVFIYGEADYRGGANRDTVESGGRDYIIFFLVIGFFGFLAVFTYHIIERFPELKSFLLKTVHKIRRKTTRKFGKSEISTAEQSSFGYDADFTSSINKNHSTKDDDLSSKRDSKHKVVTHSELREPLLDEGSAEIVSLPASSIPERIIQRLSN